jgi:outer membrane protein assembly factor BamB
MNRLMGKLFGMALPTMSLAAVATIGLAADWPQFRGPEGEGVSADTGLPTTWGESENIVWKIKLNPGTSSPIFVGDRIYLTSYSGYNVPGQSGGDQEDLKRQVVCLSRKDGKQIWATEVPSKLPEQDKIRDDHGYASNTAVCDGERIYAFFGKSGVFALDLKGKQLWHADVGDEIHNWGSAASPVLHSNLVIVNASVESQSLVALNKQTGKEVWRARGINDSWNTPILVKTQAGKTEIVVAIQGSVLGFDPANGNQLWTCDTDIPWYMVPSIVSEKGIVYCIGGRGTGGALAIKTGGRGDVTDSHRLWVGGKGSNVSSPILHEGHLYWAHESNGTVYCLNAETGDEMYAERLPRAGQFYASPVLADGKIYYVTRDGKTFVVAAKPEFELLATNSLGRVGTFNACPVVADGRLFLRSDQHLYCIDE